ncbi:MAG: hypothetical protein WB761_13225, partial [Solirubrobacteraceae bacterium]
MPLRSLSVSDKGGDRIRDEDVAGMGGNQQSTADRTAGARRLPLRLRDQPRRRHSTTLLVWTKSTTASSRCRNSSASPASGSHEMATSMPLMSGGELAARLRDEDLLVCDCRFAGEAESSRARYL